ncbi:endoribonuclease YBEY, chloroplastic-like isoform X1 [Rosa rugosa]|uniref:endoribonuclease YBEY, chloroplastic-like isoform X1 n=1 Tax=Rosa rugosa TaxID=74645 RepID=UPI002B417105|nr:endoribonuclease YBEY, chloroplastic-like isoform X1 [Rosa rugosa]
MARCVPRATLISTASFPKLVVPGRTNRVEASKSALFGRKLHALCRYDRRDAARPLVRTRVFAGQKEKELQVNVSVSIEQGLPEDHEISRIAELLRLNVRTALNLAFGGLKDSGGGFESAELSVILCNDEFMRKRNKESRDEDRAIGVVSKSKHVSGLKIPNVVLGDIVISVEMAARQAEQRGHTLLDEMRLLMVQGLLHLLRSDHEISKEATGEMEKEEERLLDSLGWKGKRMVASDAETHPKANEGKRWKKEGSLRLYKPKFKYVFCDMDGTLLNSKSQLSSTTARALKEASSRGVKIVIATGKARPAVMRVFKMVDLAGKDGIVSEFSPGVYLQGLLVYGIQGQEICKRNLDPNVCREACLYSLENKVPLIAFSKDRCSSLFDHPYVDAMHTVYHEPKAEIMPSVEQFLAAADIQKLVFMDTAEGVSTALRPYWSEATGDRATVVQTVPDMLELVPPGTSKGIGVKMLLDHLGITAKEIMAIGDGENDVEMLELAGLGICLSNGSEKTKAVANVIGASNDEDGAADAIYRYAL